MPEWYRLAATNTFVCSKCIRRATRIFSTQHFSRSCSTNSHLPHTSHNLPTRPKFRPYDSSTTSPHQDAKLAFPSQLRRLCRSYATHNSPANQYNFAVLGAGITGLSTAYYLSKEFPKAKITIFEKQSRLGGWIKSNHVELDGHEVMFESGPRSLRTRSTNSFLTLRLAQDLDLQRDIVTMPNSAPASRNRFIYYPDHLIRLPGPPQSIFGIAQTVWQEPIFKGLVRSCLSEAFRRPPRPKDMEDESVGDFLSRRFSPAIANNLASAFVHGIYAGDLYRLSVKSIFPQLWMYEDRYGCLGDAFFNMMMTKSRYEFCDDIELTRIIAPKLDRRLFDVVMSGSSIFTFARGLQQLPDAMAQHLRNQPNVQVHPATEVEALTRHGASDIEVTHKPTNTGSDKATRSTFTHCISTIPSSTLNSLIPPPLRAPPSSHQPSIENTLTHTPSVTVAVVNLYYSTPNLLETLTLPGGPARNLDGPLRGFGYLIPATVPFSQNPERALGVIFDSDSSGPPAQVNPYRLADVPPETGTRLTVMLGGHWWDGWSSLPSSSECVDMAKAVLERHLGLKTNPSEAVANIHHNCIPQYTVGHSARMHAGHRALDAAFAGRLRVAGSWYTGVGVNDCIRAGWDIVQGFHEDAREPGGEDWKGVAKRRTGLERFAWGRPMAVVRRDGKHSLTVVKMDHIGIDRGYHDRLANLPQREEDEEEKK